MSKKKSIRNILGEKIDCEIKIQKVFTADQKWLMEELKYQKIELNKLIDQITIQRKKGIETMEERIQDSQGPMKSLKYVLLES